MKSFSVIVSFVILFQSFGLEINDFTQLDEFIEHAQFHSQEYGDGFFVFVSKHYGGLKSEHSKNHQEEKKDHEQLPFQHHRHLSSIAVFAFGLPNVFDTTVLDFSDCKSHKFFYQESSSVLYVEGLLQPPRFI